MHQYTDKKRHGEYQKASIINVIDSIMGSGKTNYVIAEMNAHPEQRYLYVTPYLDEISRIIAACPELSFHQPTEEISKTASLRALLSQGENIAISHELFSRQELTPALYNYITVYGYTLILDEVLEVIQPVTNISKSEARMLFEQGWIEADEKTGIVRWLQGDKKTSRFRDIRAKALSHSYKPPFCERHRRGYETAVTFAQ